MCCYRGGGVYTRIRLVGVGKRAEVAEERENVGWQGKVRERKRDQKIDKG